MIKSDLLSVLTSQYTHTHTHTHSCIINHVISCRHVTSTRHSTTHYVTTHNKCGRNITHHQHPSSVALQFLKNLGLLTYSFSCEVSQQETGWSCQYHAQSPTWRTDGLHLVWILPFNLSGLGDPASSLRSRQHSCRGHQSSQASPPTACASTRL